MVTDKAFNTLVDEFEKAWVERYKRPVARSQVFWDATRYYLYGVVPCYMEDDDGLRRFFGDDGLLREEPLDPS